MNFARANKVRRRDASAMIPDLKEISRSTVMPYLRFNITNIVFLAGT